MPINCTYLFSTPIKIFHKIVTYFAMYDEQFIAQISEGKIRMRIIHGYNNPMYNAQKHGCAFTWENGLFISCIKIIRRTMAFF